MDDRRGGDVGKQPRVRKWHEGHHHNRRNGVARRDKAKGDGTVRRPFDHRVPEGVHEGGEEDDDKDVGGHDATVTGSCDRTSPEIALTLGGVGDISFLFVAKPAVNQDDPRHVERL